MSDKYAVNKPVRSHRLIKVAVIVLVVVAAGLGVYKLLAPSPAEKAADNIQFDDSVSTAEKTTIQTAIKNQSKTYQGEIKASIKTTTQASSASLVLSAYVPVTNVYSTKQQITSNELAQQTIFVPSDTEEKVKAGIASVLKVDPSKLSDLSSSVEDISADSVAIIPIGQLSPKVKLLTFDGTYYLDSYKKGAIFRQAAFSGDSTQGLAGLKLNDFATKDTTLKVNMTGVTALTRAMIIKLNSVKDPTYFSQKIGSYLANADITHVSNEVSFKPGCPVSDAVFCAPPAMIGTLKDSGVDLVELTGNHNNDTGNQYNTDTINLYHKLGWHTFGGGLNTIEAAKPYLTDQKGSKVAFLGYNYPDSPNGNPIAKSSSAGANSFDFNKIKSDIDAAKGQGNFVIVDVQFWECFAYPDGYVEFPECDKPITMQEETFRKIADLGADMVIGTQAHQPQTYEMYHGKPIYYGLGNLYFEQTQWPGTERGIILSHYFTHGKLVQTKLAPTVYDKALQTHLMGDSDAVELLTRLDAARP